MNTTLPSKNIFSWLNSVYRFYLDGFRSMTLGKTLWKVILIKLFVIFALLKVFVFSDYLQTNFSNDEMRSAHVLQQLTHQSKPTRKYPGSFQVQHDNSTSYKAEPSAVRLSERPTIKTVDLRKTNLIEEEKVDEPD